ncbi:MAG TPA: TOBE domain-containing protein [Candidatus Desulfovibrio intestinigallinarum]|nr:TOBE domain-containing protein [Candidatus Desulfovibrio intestinigallinarum]
MKHSSDNARLTALWHDLSSEDRQWLRQKLLRHNAAGVWSDDGCLDAAEMRIAENWFHERAACALTSREKTSRLRLWLIFMVLRHAGLRWVEVEQLRRQDVDLTTQCIHIAGAHARDVPLSPMVAAQLGTVLDDPSGIGATLLPVEYDASHIRRNLQRCGEECGLPRGLLTARGLRRSRGLELRRQGLPDLVVDAFLGRPRHGGDIIRHDPRNVARLLRDNIQRGGQTRSSARNVTHGRIEALTPRGILVCVSLSCPEGLRLDAVITDASRRRLGLEVGGLVCASVKAPWVELVPEAQPLPPPSGLGASAGVPQNIFQARVADLRGDDDVVEAVARLPGGGEWCAVRYRAEDPWCSGLREGDVVQVRFSASAVILNSLDPLA